MLRSAFFVLTLAAFASTAGVADDKKPSGKPDAAQTTRPQDKGLDKMMPFTGPAVDPKSYIIGPEDVLYVRVWREPDLSGPVSVGPDGKISMQLINEVQAAGKTPEQLTSAITQSLGKYMNHPEVNVQVATVNSKKYFISGEVMRPGAYPLAVPTRVLEALIQAGGFRDFAKTKKIYVLRGQTKYNFNYKDVSKGKRQEENILLENGDTIFVP